MRGFKTRADAQISAMTERINGGFSWSKEEAIAYMEQITLFGPAQHGEQSCFRVEVDPETMIATIDTRATRLPTSDPKGVQTFIGLGAAIEHLAQTASAFGYSMPDDKLIHNFDVTPPYLCATSAELRLEEPKCDIDLLMAVLNRRTIRGPHIKESLHEDIAKYCGIPITDPEIIRLMSELVTEGFVRKLSNPNFREELFKSFVRVGSIESAQEGMLPSLLGLPPLPPERILPASTLGELTCFKPLIKLLAYQEGQKFAKTSGVLVYTGDISSPLSIITVGRICTRDWIAASARGFDVHLNAIFVEDDISRENLRTILGIEDDPIVVLRIGHVDPKHRLASTTPPKPIITLSGV